MPKTKRYLRQKLSQLKKTHPETHSHAKFGFVFFLFLLLFLTISLKLFFWQVIKAPELAQAAKNQYQREVIKTGRRGDILTADGYVLATNRRAFRLFAQPRAIDPEKKQEIAKSLAMILVDYEVRTSNLPPEYEGMSETAIKEKRVPELTENLLNKLEKDKSWISLYLELDEETKKQLAALGYKYIGFDEYQKRFYPEASMAAQLVGFVGKNDKGEDVGYFGIEGGMNKELAGRKIKKTFLTDALGYILSDSALDQQSLDGRDVTLTIRRDLQYLAQKHLEEGIKKYGAEEGEILIMDPKTGAVLANAVWPTFDPNKFFRYDPSIYKNPSLTSLYEPGSTFKTLTVASGIDAGVITPKTQCTNCSGPRKIDKYTIRTWNNKYHPNITITEALAKSDNIAMIFIAEKLGVKRLKEYLKSFGIGQAIGFDLQGDRNTPFPKKWGPVELATISFGQGIVTNSYQLTRAIATIANKGQMMQPFVVKKVVDKATGETIEFEPKALRQVISPYTASQVTKMMVEAAMHGEAKWTASQDHWVAGKTGTSQVPEGGKYAEDKTIASFIAFAPPEDPKFIMLVKLVAPSSSPWAAETAAPLWYQTAKDVYLVMGIPPDREE